MEEQAQASQLDPQDVEKNKPLAIIGYIFPIIFFIPLLTEAKDSPFAKFHANQQLILLLFAFIGFTASSILTIVFIGLILFPIIMIAALVFMVMGIINAANGEIKRLPIVGGFDILK